MTRTITKSQKSKDYKVIVRQIVEVERFISLPIPTEKEMKDEGAKYPSPEDAINAFLDVHPEKEDFYLKNARTFVVYEGDECKQVVSK